MRGREVAFWTATASAGWVLAGYPALLLARPRRAWRRDVGVLPRMSLVVPAYREREALARKLEALAALDYPADRLEVLVAVDADAQLVEVVRAARPGARVLFRADRGGKAAALNRAVAAASGDVVILTDANNVLGPGSLRAAAQHFADPGVWAVAGRRGEDGSAYEAYEDLVRRLETRSGNVAAASGEFFAVRRERLPAFEESVVNDDLWLLCRLVADGGRVVYEPGASTSEPALGRDAELARRARIGAGRVMVLSGLRQIPAALAWRLLCHQHGRAVLPLLLVVVLLSSASLAGRRPYRAVAVAQAGAYALGLLSLAGHRPPLLPAAAGRVMGQFLLGNYALAMGGIRALRRRQGVRWDAVR